MSVYTQDMNSIIERTGWNSEEFSILRYKKGTNMCSILTIPVEKKNPDKNQVIFEK